MEPINVATPNWACPYCHRKYGADLDAATECANCGPADGEGALPTIAVWHHHVSPGTTNARFDVIELGGIRRDGNRHVLTYSNGAPASAGIGVTPDTLIEFGWRHDDSAPDAAYISGKALAAFCTNIHGKVPSWPHGDRYDPQRSTLYSPSFYNEPFWLGPLTDEVREVFDTLLPGPWERLQAIVDGDDRYPTGNRLAGEYRWSGLHTDDRYNGGGTFKMPLIHATFLVAEAHGFPLWDRIGVSRWLADHKPVVLDWLHAQVVGWVNGDPDARVPLLDAVPSVTQPGFRNGDLPKKPNKRRIEKVGHWTSTDPADDYRWYSDVIAAALGSLRCDGPTISIAPTATEFRK